MTLDHRQDGPAYGWVAGLRCAGDVLVARLKDLDESLREWIRAGAYKKRSIELYRSFAATGRPYLRAVSFLGACPPEVKGLADPIFREDEGERVVVEFEDGPAGPAGGHEAEAAPSAGATAKGEGAAFAELESLRGETQRLSDELERAQQDRQRAGLERFCDALRRDGRLLPAWEENGLVPFLLTLGVEPAIETADGRRVSPLAWFEEFVQSLAPPLELRELAPATAAVERQRPALPQPTGRAALRPSTLALHERAVAYCDRHPGATYIEALESVARL